MLRRILEKAAKTHKEFVKSSVASFYIKKDLILPDIRYLKKNKTDKFITKQ